jgi:hypothetical protein
LLSGESVVKSSAHTRTTSLYQILGKEALFNGFSKTYQPLHEEGEQFPDESNIVQARVVPTLKEFALAVIPLFDLDLQKDSANQIAKADVEVDGVVILKDAPATYLLWLEKWLTDFHTEVKKVPILPQNENWTFDENQDCFRSPPSKAVKTKKTPRAFVKYEATKEHPAQVDMTSEDNVVGYWTTTKFSGALPKQKVQALLDKVERLQLAVKHAREKANTIEIPEVRVGVKMFDYLLTGL